MPDRGPSVVNTGNGGAWAVASVLVLLIVGALFVFGGNLFDGAGDTDVNVNVPKVEAPAGGQGTQDAPGGGQATQPAPSGAKGTQQAPSGGTP
ncbi:hypothetical protein [Sinorhizobium fredii]|uniref:hypothetical protein n=1 Tax=Rhizobium fredii TaxID=380 RepID=UPI0009B5E89E|nr:hypothetical protein [Sinorhizobium fredii]